MEIDILARYDRSYLKNMWQLMCPCSKHTPSRIQFYSIDNDLLDKIKFVIRRIMPLFYCYERKIFLIAFIFYSINIQYNLELFFCC